MPRAPKIFPRCRKPSLNELLGVSQAKRKISRNLGLATLRDPTTPLRNTERRLKYKISYYSEPIKFMRALGILRKRDAVFHC